MGIIELILIAVGLAMDAFAVSICKGLNMKKINYVHGAIIALFFGVFQSLMPLIGWLVGSSFSSYITQFDHWIAFILLVLIGGNMIRESLQEEEEEGEDQEDRLDYKELFLLAIATSIDALAVGITFAFLQVEIISSVLIIGAITFVISFVGVIIGNLFGSKFKNKAEIVGGIILILIGIKILLEHLNIL
jgi:putative Mn2+ efflux pump MntP